MSGSIEECRKFCDQFWIAMIAMVAPNYCQSKMVKRVADKEVQKT